jgi:phosphonopyruvate decarboxylase
MISAGRFIDSARQHGFTLYTGVPCSYLKPFINYVIDASELRYIGAANEGDAVAIAAGAELGGVRSVVMFQNSGLGNAVNPLTSLTWTFRIPVLLIATLRGEPGGEPDEPQHELMGQVTTRMLELMEIPWAYFPADEAEIDGVLERALAHMDREARPYALVMRKGSVRKTDLRSAPDTRPRAAYRGVAAQPYCQREDMLRAVQELVSPDDILIATTGYTGRELYACEDRPNQLYMVGSMGCATSLGLGLAVACPDRRVIVLDGDGAALMRPGGMATVGYERPPHLTHLLIDNGIHESTGGQSTVSQSIDFPTLAAACGYPRVGVAATPAQLSAYFQPPPPGLTFVHVPVFPGIASDLPRPSIRPHQVASRLRAHLAGASDQ